MKKKIKKAVKKASPFKDISLTFDAKLFKHLGKGVKEKLTSDQLKIVKNYAKRYKEHFTKDKWDLNYSFLIQDLLAELLGFNPEYLFLEYLTKKMPLHLKNSSESHKGLVLSLKRGK